MTMATDAERFRNMTDEQYTDLQNGRTLCSTILKAPDYAEKIAATISGKARLSHAMGYDAEVSEPNGQPVHGYVLARWADSREPEFQRWLTSLLAQAAREGYALGLGVNA